MAHGLGAANPHRRAQPSPFVSSRVHTGGQAPRLSAVCARPSFTHCSERPTKNNTLRATRHAAMSAADRKKLHFVRTVPLEGVGCGARHKVGSFSGCAPAGAANNTSQISRCFAPRKLRVPHPKTHVLALTPPSQFVRNFWVLPESKLQHLALKSHICSTTRRQDMPSGEQAISQSRVCKTG